MRLGYNQEVVTKPPIVLVNGTFNIVHAGHCELFEFASRYGDLIVGINSDRYVYDKYKQKHKRRVQS